MHNVDGELAWPVLEPDTGLDHCPRILLSWLRTRTSDDRSDFAAECSDPSVNCNWADVNLAALDSDIISIVGVPFSKEANGVYKVGGVARSVLIKLPTHSSVKIVVE